MGIGMVIAVRAADQKTALTALKSGGEKPVVIGHIEKGTGVTRLI